MKIDKVMNILMIVILLLIALYRNNVAVLCFSIVLFGIMSYTTFRIRTHWNVATYILLTLVLIIWNIYLWI
ncbi:hypothetical protein PAXY110619_22815 [Paenibacillus xylanexedens]|uniref:Uncharacterized protein n=1 Tax=Paenibacillus xylanexedens TaxID=528191 RepID=A0ABS4RQG9_PAEXY|nr:hypothetical protein [Paenibacillus xylanexedens]